MPHVTAVSFDADGIRVVTGRRTRNGFEVERSLFMTVDELDAFLALDRAGEYLVAVNPADALFETITIPPVAPGLEATLIQTETARLHPELVPFSCSWQVMGDLPLEGRTVRKIACCLVPHQSLEPLLEPFIRHHKPIRRLVAAPVILAALVRSVEPTDEPLLCAHDSGTSKLLFLLEDGAVTFSRAISSHERGWDLFDRQNVAMTMDYCFQSLRIRPSRVVVLNPSETHDETAPAPRLGHLELPPQLQTGLPPAIMQEYQVPFLLAAWPLPATANLLPDSYQSAQLQQVVLKRGCQLFGIAAVLLLILISLQIAALTSLESKLDSLRSQESALAATHQAHRQALAQHDQILPMINALSSFLSAADIPTTLATLNGFNTPQARLHSLVIRRSQESLNLQLAGMVTAAGFAASQEQFEDVITALQRIKGITPGTRSLDPKTRTFTIEATAKP